MSIYLGDIDLISVYLMLRFGLFGSIGNIKTANQIKPYSWVKKWFEHIQTKFDFLRFQFRLVQFTIFLLNLFDFESMLL